MLIPFLLAAVLGGPDGALASPPAAPEAIVAQVATPAGTGSAACVAEPECFDRAPVSFVAIPFQDAVLVDVQILEKYRSFRESLSTP